MLELPSTLYTFFVACGAFVDAVDSLRACGSNNLVGELSQADSLLTHVLGEITAIWLVAAGRADVMFGHWSPQCIRFPMVTFVRSLSFFVMLHMLYYVVIHQLCCIDYNMLILVDSACVVLDTYICIMQT